jgi:hypothetical protein
MVNCIEELGNKWRVNHLSNKITSIELPIKHDTNYAINIIKESIDKDKDKSYILTRFVEKNNAKRETIYYLSTIFFKDKIGEKYEVENFNKDIWKSSDEYIIKEMISIARNWKNFDSKTIDIDDYNKFLNFLYEINDKLFDEVKLLSSRSGEFNYLKDLNFEYNINEEIKNGAKEYIGLKYDERILNDKINYNKNKNKNF